MCLKKKVEVLSNNYWMIIGVIGVERNFKEIIHFFIDIFLQ